MSKPAPIITVETQGPHVVLVVSVDGKSIKLRLTPDKARRTANQLQEAADKCSLGVNFLDDLLDIVKGKKR
jgi:hypothetical protein